MQRSIALIVGGNLQTNFLQLVYMYNKMKNTLPIAIVLTMLFTSCNPFISKELRRKNKINRKIERFTKRFPEALKTDTITKTVNVEVPKIQIDSVIIIEPDTMWLSEIKNDTIREFVRSKVVNSIPFKDTITHVIDGITFKFFPDAYGNIRYSVTKPPEVIIKEIQIEQQTVQKIKLSIFEQLFNYLGSWTWLGVILFAIWLLFRLVKYFK